MGMLLELVDRLDRAMARGAWAEVGGYYAEDAVFEDGTHHVEGRAAIIAYWRAAFEGVNDAEVVTIRAVEAGDALAIETETTATHRDTGRPLRVPTMAHLRFVGGLIVEEHQYLDTGLVQAQLAPPPTILPLAVVHALVEAYDAADWEAYGALFHDDAVVETLGKTFEGRAAIVAHERSIPHTTAARDSFLADQEQVWHRWSCWWHDEAGQHQATTGATHTVVRDGRVTHMILWGWTSAS
jgi:ketosteroid isomerase-like protein